MSSLLKEFHFCRAKKVIPEAPVNRFVLSTTHEGKIQTFPVFESYNYSYPVTKLGYFCTTKLVVFEDNNTKEEFCVGGMTIEEKLRYSRDECDKFLVEGGRVVGPQQGNQKRYAPMLHNKNCLKMCLSDNGELYFEDVIGKTVPVAVDSDKADLIAYIPNGNNTKWFICSEQFMKLCTIMQYDKHPSYQTKKNKGNGVLGLEHYLCNGNRLKPGAHRYYVSSRKQNGLPLILGDLQDLFWAQRYEELIQEHPDLYVAFARMLVYGRELCYSNIPTVGLDAPPKADSAGQAQQIEWCAPVEKLVRFMISCGWVVENFEETVRRFRGVKPEVLVGSDLKREENNAALKRLHAELEEDFEREERKMCCTELKEE